MRIALDSLPTDTTMLQQLVRDMAAALDEGQTEIDRLRLIIRQFQRARFGRSAERHAARVERSKPLLEALRAWLDLQLSRLPSRSKLAEAIRYALGRWTSLIWFLDDGRIDLDNNPVERAIRPIALGRKNSLFAGSEGGARRWAISASLIESAKLNGIEPYAWLDNTLTCMANGHPHQCLDELLPWCAL